MSPYTDAYCGWEESLDGCDKQTQLDDPQHSNFYALWSNLMLLSLQSPGVNAKGTFVQSIFN
jgi:hypothetical protein